jgi:hypothetical protein
MAERERLWQQYKDDPDGLEDLLNGLDLHPRLRTALDAMADEGRHPKAILNAALAWEENDPMNPFGHTAAAAGTRSRPALPAPDQRIVDLLGAGSTAVAAEMFSTGWPWATQDQASPAILEAA